MREHELVVSFLNTLDRGSGADQLSSRDGLAGWGAEHELLAWGAGGGRPPGAAPAGSLVRW
jgi:hypothetical protein